MMMRCWFVLFLVVLFGTLVGRTACAMNTGELIDAVARDARVSQNDATRAVNDFIATVTTALQKGNSVQLAGFGTWSVSTKRPARGGSNVVVVQFKAGADKLSSRRKVNRRRRKKTLRRTLRNDDDDKRNNNNDKFATGRVTPAIQKVARQALDDNHDEDAAWKLLTAVAHAGHESGKFVAFDTVGVRDNVDGKGVGKNDNNEIEAAPLLTGYELDSGIVRDAMQAILDHSNLPRSVLKRAVRCMLQIIIDTLVTGEPVEILPQLGVFGIRAVPHDRETDDLDLVATFTAPTALEASVVAAMRDETLQLYGKEGAQVTRLCRSISFCVRDGNNPQPSVCHADDFAVVSLYMVHAATEMVALSNDIVVNGSKLQALSKGVLTTVTPLGDDLQQYFAGVTANERQAAGTRVRKAMHDLKTLAQDIRVQVQAIQKQGQKTQTSPHMQTSKTLI